MEKAINLCEHLAADVVTLGSGGCLHHLFEQLIVAALHGGNQLLPTVETAVAVAFIRFVVPLVQLTLAAKAAQLQLLLSDAINPLLTLLLQPEQPRQLKARIIG
jgi:hypothetical protein